MRSIQVSKFKSIFGVTLVAAVLMNFAGVPRASAAEETKIGTVDMQKALQTVEAGKKAKSQLEKDVTAKRKELETEESSIKKMIEEFKKQSLVMSDEARNKKETEIRERGMKWEQNRARSQMELQQKEQELTQPILVKLRGIISELAKQRGYTVVLERNENTVLFSQDKDDLTGEVVSAYNKAKS